ncbi:MAG: hypothetical protein WBC71_12410 [Salaquimonas sp.]
MPLQNRASPDGQLHVDAARGLFTGNRGIIHDPDNKTLLRRRWSTAAWICCSLEWKGRRREPWGRNGPNQSAGWTELFFLDEVTALAAGHRPCHTCRCSDALRFHEAFCAANGEHDAQAKNKILHKERWHSSKELAAKQEFECLGELPDGAIVEIDALFYAIKNQRLLHWSFNRYLVPQPFEKFCDASLRIVTPNSIIMTLRQGYQPVWHPSAS